LERTGFIKAEWLQTAKTLWWRLDKALSPELIWPVLAAIIAFWVGKNQIPMVSIGPFGLFFFMLMLGAFIFSPFSVLLVFVAVLFTRPAEFFPGITEYQPAKTFAICATVLLLLSKLTNRDLTLARSSFNKWMYLLAAAVFVSVIFSTDRVSSMRYFAEVFVKIVILWVLFVNLVESRKRTVQMQVLISILTASIAGYAIWGKITGAVAVEGTRSSFVGYLGDPNDLAMTLLISVGFTLEAVFEHKGWKRIFFGVLLLSVLGGLISTQSRGGILGLGAIMYVFIWRRTRSHIFTMSLALGGLVLLSAVSGIGDRATVSSESGVIDTSAMGRLDAWRAGARMLYYNPFHGVGINQVVENYGVYAVNPVSWRPKTSHNMYVQCMAETGLGGIIGLLMLCLSTIWVNWKLLWEIPEDAGPTERAFLNGQLGNSLGLMVAAFFLSVAWYWFPYIVFAQAATSDRVWLKDAAFETVKKVVPPAPRTELYLDPPKASVFARWRRLVSAFESGVAAGHRRG
jgi:putative inorganic carbon (HCO3(-)) transporter